MNDQTNHSPESILLSLVPADGTPIGNQALRELFLAQAADATDADFDQVRDALIAQGVLVRGKGRGGSVRRAAAAESPATDDDGFSLAAPEPPAPSAPTAKPKQAAAPSAPRAASGEDAQILSYRHPDKRKNNPEVGMVTPATDPAEAKTVWRYDPHLDPELQFDPNRAKIEALIDDALASGNEDTMRAALEELKRLQSPYLNWAGKAERTSFEVDTVSLHVHERIDPMSILSTIEKI